MRISRHYHAHIVASEKSPLLSYSEVSLLSEGKRVGRGERVRERDVSGV
jgi:hypothetical protein